MSELFDGIERVVAKRDLASTNQPFLEGYFSGVDISKSTDYYLLTRNPAKLAKMWPEVAKHDGSEVINPKYRHNVIIGVPCKTQAEADRLMPELLKLSGLCRGLWVDLRGQTEEITFRWAKWQPFGTQPGETTDELDGLRKIHFITLGGIDQPVHPQWLRTVRDQCKAAGVALWFDGHGDWLAIDDAGLDVLKNTSSYEAVDMLPSGLIGKQVTPATCREQKSLPTTFYKVGRDRSSHQLDGVEHRQALTRGDA